MKKLALHWKIIIGMVLGIIWSLLSSSLGWSQFTLDWIAPFGTIFINLLKLIAIPLVLFSIINGIASMGSTTNLGRLGFKTLGLYFLTTVFSVGFGLLLVNVFQPGVHINKNSRIDNRISYEIWANEHGVEIKDSKNFLLNPQYTDRVQNLSGELVDASAIESRIKTAEALQDQSPLQFLVDIVPENLFMSLSNNSLMLQIIFFAIFFSIALLFIPQEKARPVMGFIEGCLEVFLKMVDFVMQAAPFFVFALLAGVVSEMAQDDVGKVVEIFKGLSWYTLTVLGGLLFMIFVFYPLLIHFFVKKISYRDFLKAMSPAQTLAFSTSSSAATLPVTMECVENNLGVEKKITGFVLPIGATVNMDGTSMYQAIAVVFLAQLHIIDLTLTQQLIIVSMSVLASIGAAPVPSAGLVMLIIIMDAVGLNPAWIAIIFPVDRILDMFRTVVNITGDATVTTIIAQSEGKLHYNNPPDSPTETFDLES